MDMSKEQLQTANELEKALFTELDRIFNGESFLQEAGLNPEKYDLVLGKNGRVIAEHKNSHRRITIGVRDIDGKITITKPLKKAPKDTTKHSVTFYIDDMIYDRLTRTALLQGDTVSGYVRDLVIKSLFQPDQPLIKNTTPQYHKFAEQTTKRAE